MTMDSLNTVAQLREFCKQKNISFSISDRKNDLLDKIEAWEDEQISRSENIEKEVKLYTARQFGQLQRLDLVMIQYLEKQFSKTQTNTLEEWKQICIDKKVID